MRVILLNVNAKSGSTGKIVTDIKNVLEQNGHECLICYGANDKSEEGYKRICPETERKTNAVLNRLTGIPHGFFLPFSFFRLKKVIDNWHPDIMVVVEHDGVVGVGLEVVDVVGVGAVGHVLSPLEGVVGGYVADKPLGEVCAVVFPCQRGIAAVDGLDAGVARDVEVVEFGLAGLLF